VEKAKSLPLGGLKPLPRPHFAAGASTVLFFSPHPDDECISAGLALRLLREQGMKVLNVAVTQGSNKPRQVQRYHELQAACDHLGLGLIETGPVGLERITPKRERKTLDTGHAALMSLSASLENRSQRWCSARMTAIGMELTSARTGS
jgi:hypothetical protein